MMHETTRTAKTNRKSLKRPTDDAIPAGGAAGDWRVETLGRIRSLIHKAVPEAVEEIKWRKPSNAMRGVPVWSHHGIICTGETYKGAVKLTFAKGASLPDPAGLFNASLGGNARRAIDLREGDRIDERAFRALVRAAAAMNADGPRRASPAGRSRAASPAAHRANAMRPVLLAGGNPRIAKADGDAPVRAYIEAMPGWKRDIGRRLDALIERTVPDVRKAVKWNSPFYGSAGRADWFLAFHVFAKYVKVSFFRGTLLDPVPPGGTGKDARWIDIHEDDLDEKQIAVWVKQASRLPGWGGGRAA
jgi:hypothetical protein